MQFQTYSANLQDGKTSLVIPPSVSENNAPLRDFLDAVQVKYSLPIDSKRMHIIAQTLSQNGIILVGHLKDFGADVFQMLEIPENLAQAVLCEFGKGRSPQASLTPALDMVIRPTVNNSQAQSGRTCGLCSRGITGPSIALSCTHEFCSIHLSQYINKLVADGLPIDMKCPSNKCYRTIQPFEIKTILSSIDYERWETACFNAWSNDNMITCPNSRCNSRISMQTIAPPSDLGEIKECDDDGKLLNENTYRHFLQHRIRCRECHTNFCSNCKTTPYHKGFDCDEWVNYKGARKCRFCEEPLTEENSREVATGTPKTLADVCNEEDCVSRAEIACHKFLPCGCACGGVKDEKTCLPCLEHKLNVKEDFCAICYTEALGAAPCIQLGCNHVIHFACAKTKLTAGYTGARITFGFLDCTVCRAQMVHPSLTALLEPHLHMKELVARKAMERLEFERLTNDPRIVSDTKSDFYRKPVEFALHRYLFFRCFTCKKPYFGGAYECGGADPDIDHNDLICPRCQPPSENISECKEHGSDWIAFKCRFCCNIANFFCWGNTHFCDNCHKPGVWQNLVNKVKGENKKDISAYPQCPGLVNQINMVKNNKNLTAAQKEAAFKALRSDPKTCPGGTRHPPNGFEHGLGCSMCADGDNEEQNQKAAAKAKEETKDRIFTYASDGDANGLIYFLGTSRGSKPFQNPMTPLGVIKVTGSELDPQSLPVSAVVGRETVRCITKSMLNCWFIINLKTAKLRPTHYSLRHYSSFDNEALRNWRFAGSTDGKSTNWDTLFEHKNDAKLNRKGQIATWRVPPENVKNYYSYFCIIQTGTNSSGNNHLALSGFEIYGEATFN